MFAPYLIGDANRFYENPNNSNNSYNTPLASGLKVRTDRSNHSRDRNELGGYRTARVSSILLTQQCTLTADQCMHHTPQTIVVCTWFSLPEHCCKWEFWCNQIECRAHGSECIGKQSACPRTRLSISSQKPIQYKESKELDALNWTMRWL